MSKASPTFDAFCNNYFCFTELGLSVDLSRSGVTLGTIDAMRARAQQAFAAMEALESGAIANPDEQRMVGHYWLRTPERSPSEEIAAEIRTSITRVKEFARKVHAGEIRGSTDQPITKLLLIGIGGSALGPQLLSEALWSPSDAIELYFFDNTDPDGFATTLAKLDGSLDQCLALVVSKSGGTVETRNGALEATRAFQCAGLDAAKHMVALTVEGSTLDKQALQEEWLARFHLWDWVGGRTSIFSVVGLLPAALQGVDIDSFLLGARAMDSHTREGVVEKNPAMLLAIAWHAIGGGHGTKDMVVLPYRDRLQLFSKYLQQLVMESLGKERNLDGHVVHQGLAVYGNKGSTDQHAYVQQLRDGINNFFVTFVEVLRENSSAMPAQLPLEVEEEITVGDYLQGFYLGTRQALFENQRVSVSLTLDALSPASLGSLIALYDRAVGFYASLVNINAYHQPGVEAGKKAASYIVDLKKQACQFLEAHAGNAYGAQEIALSIGKPEDAELLFLILLRLSSNRGRIVRGGDRLPQTARFEARALGR